MRSIIFIVLSFVLFSLTSNVYSSEQSEQFPKRKFYPQLDYIDTQTFAEGLKQDRYDVLDVRDDTSYKALHVIGASNISVKSKDFEQQILDYVAKHTKPIVVYCNGISCSKSYIASSKMKDLFAKQHIKTPVITYDSGINAIAHAQNTLVLKNGKKVSKNNPLISVEELEKHMLEPAEFENYLSSHTQEEYVLLDIRDKREKVVNKLFTFLREKKIPLDKREKLIGFLNKIKQDEKTLLVYDSSGRQINGIYELIEIIEINKWHYMKGGEFGYSKYAIESAGL